MGDTVAVVTNIPRPYRDALFSIVRRRLAGEDVALYVIYASDPSKHLRRGSPTNNCDLACESVFARVVSLRRGYERVISFPTNLRHILTDCDPCCVVVGGFGPGSLRSALWCHHAGVPYVLWSGAWSGQAIMVSRLQALSRKWLVHNSSAFIAYGTAAAEHLVHLGAPASRVYCAWNTVDLEAIASAARAAKETQPRLTAKYRLADTNLLYVGTLVHSKGLRELLSAALTMRPQEPDWAVHLVGEGPARAELEDMVRAAGKKPHVHFHGLRPSADVAELLGLVDGLLLPTKQEAWGLVINEAMACGVPVVASPRAGATRDLIEHEVTGYVVDPDDTTAMAAIMSRLLARDPSCLQVGRAGAEAVRAKASLDRSAEGFVSAVHHALGRPPHA